MLHNIASTVPTWSKVASGLLKMYRAEVLNKVPVVQHFYFGSVLPWRRYSPGTPPFQGEIMSSSGDRMDDEERVRAEETDSAVGRQGDEGTVAPWAIPSLSGTGPGPSAAPAGRRQQQPVVAQPRPFEPPALFSSRRRLSSPLVEGAVSKERSAHAPQRETVASQGGAAAASSPFGILGKASLR